MKSSSNRQPSIRTKLTKKRHGPNQLEYQNYTQQKKKMEKYQRNIFGFSSKLEFYSFEYAFTILLTLIFSAIICSYVIQKISEIESKKFDVLRSTKIVKSYENIGKVNIIKDTYLMPFIDITVNNYSRIKQFNVFKLDGHNKDENIWDQKYVFDIQQLNRFINIVINVNTKSKGHSKYIQKSFRKCEYSDFSRRGCKIDEQDVKYLLCPDDQFLKDHMVIQNSFEAKDNR